MNYFISDTHFYHENVIKFDNRPFIDLSEMNTQLIDNWNNQVTRNDDVYILGDFCWMLPKTDEYKDICNQLKGRKHLILGNHDPRKHLTELLKYFVSVEDYKEIKYNKQVILMSHYPILFYRGDYNENFWMLHGHTHQTIEQQYVEQCTQEIVNNCNSLTSNRGHIINVGCMMPYMSYTPQPLEVLVNAWTNKYKGE